MTLDRRHAGRVLLLAISTLLTVKSFGQNGYVKLENDSLLAGYLRYYISINDAHQGIELWRTKTDKNPRKIPRRIIQEYAIKKDTFKVLHDFKPFYDSDTYFELVDAKLKARGKVNLYMIENYQNANRVSTYTGGGLIPGLIDGNVGSYTYLYILEDKKEGLFSAVPSRKEKLKELLLDFYPEKYILKYEEVKGGINYKSIPDLVKLYNSK